MTTLQIGDNAPDFFVHDQDGNTQSISQYKGKKIVLYFYPKASTPGCTVQACNLRDHYEELLKLGYVVLGVSADDAVKLQKFKDKNNLPFPLLADVEKEVIQLYGVWGPKKFMGKTYDGIHRTTFVIDEAGVISEIISKVKTKEHFEQIVEYNS